MALQKSYLKAQKQKFCNVTFELSAEAAKGAQTVHLVGDFNSWSTKETEMKKQKDGSFSVNARRRRVVSDAPVSVVGVYDSREIKKTL